MISSLLHHPSVADVRSAVPRRGIDLVSAIETALTACRHQAIDAGVEFAAQFGADLPREFVTEPACFDQILRNLAEYAIEVSGRGRVLISVRRNSGTVELTLHISDPRPESNVPPSSAKQPRGHVPYSRLEAIRENLTALDGRLNFVKRLGEGIEIGICFGLECR
jgi:hypothetical protein